MWNLIYRSAAWVVLRREEPTFEGEALTVNRGKPLLTLTPRGHGWIMLAIASTEKHGTFFHLHGFVSLSITQNTPDRYLLAYEPPVTIYMGRDKVESSWYYYYYFSLVCSSLTHCRPTDEDLIKYAWPQDVWFHVDKLSSAHVYLRLPESISSWEAIPEALLVDCAQLVKANSIEGESETIFFPSFSSNPNFLGNKRNDLTIIYTPADNLKVRPSILLISYSRSF